MSPFSLSSFLTLLWIELIKSPEVIFFNLLNSLNVVGIIILIIYNIVKYIDSYYDQYYCSDGVNRTFKEIKLDYNVGIFITGIENLFSY